ncbi:unnamed protein product [Brassica rapa]|uniref:Uncharacterized protein n=1 Tax=Brassica campestris TaxID=3711 RepID=A0A8D9GFP0_BRACM|nr:unnamed protein product [Brassica rapa]
MVAYQTFFSDVNTGRRFNTGVTRLLRFWKARNITKVGSNNGIFPYLESCRCQETVFMRLLRSSFTHHNDHSP